MPKKKKDLAPNLIHLCLPPRKRVFEEDERIGAAEMSDALVAG